jgi:hypothetical protein
LKNKRFDFKSIRFRVWLYFLGFTAVILVLIWFLQIFFLNNYYEEMKIKRMQEAANQLVALFQAENQEGFTALANQITEELNDKFRKLTKLEQVTEEGDLNLLVTIESYDVRAAAVTANEVAARNRLTVTVKVNFVNRKYPEDDFSDKSFSAYSEYDSANSLDAVESTLCTEIIDQLIEDIFNATVAQW